MDINDLMDAVLDICPNAQVGQDDDGQILIYTNMTINAFDNMVDMDEY